MKGEVILSFVARVGGMKIIGVVGEIVEIPPNVNWVSAGFVKPVQDTEKKSARKPAPKKTGASSSGE